MKNAILDKAPALAGIGLLTGLSPCAMEPVLACARLTEWPAGMRLFDQGEPAHSAHALVHGWVRISQIGSDGEESLLRFIGKGECFGTGTICTDQLYPADATAVVDVTEVSWNQSELLELMQTHPQIALNFIAILGRRLGEAQERIRELATQSVERRIAKTLLRLANHGCSQASGATVIAIPLSRKDIADIAGTTIYTASRTVSDWKRRGLVDEAGSRLVLRRPGDLERLAEAMG